MKVKQLATRNNISPDTVRHYTRIGLITPTKNPENSYKQYSRADEQRLQFIIQAKSLGFSLHDIETMIMQSQQGQSACPKVRELMELRLSEIEQKIATMQATYQKMQHAVKHWQNLPNCIPTGEHVCHLIENFTCDLTCEEDYSDV